MEISSDIGYHDEKYIFHKSELRNVKKRDILDDMAKRHLRETVLSQMVVSATLPGSRNKNAPVWAKNLKQTKSALEFFGVRALSHA